MTYHYKNINSDKITSNDFDDTFIFLKKIRCCKITLQDEKASKNKNKLNLDEKMI